MFFPDTIEYFPSHGVGVITLLLEVPQTLIKTTLRKWGGSQGNTKWWGQGLRAGIREEGGRKQLGQEMSGKVPTKAQENWEGSGQVLWDGHTSDGGGLRNPDLT